MGHFALFEPELKHLIIHFCHNETLPIALRVCNRLELFSLSNFANVTGRSSEAFAGIILPFIQNGRVKSDVTSLEDVVTLFSDIWQMAIIESRRVRPTVALERVTPAKAKVSFGRYRLNALVLSNSERAKQIRASAVKVEPADLSQPSPSSVPEESVSSGPRSSGYVRRSQYLSEVSASNQKRG